MKKFLSIICSVLLCLSTCGLVATNFTARADEDAPLLVSELFLPSSVSIEPISVDSEVNYLESGLKLVSDDVTESVQLRSDLVGGFELEYLPEKVNGAYSASQFSVTFTDESGVTFDLVVEHGATMNVYVNVNGEKAGVFYNGGNHGGLTTLCNQKGTYTQVAAEKLLLTFEPETMSVYAGAAGESKTLVWCLLEDEIDGRSVSKTLVPFNKYSVSFSISGLSGTADEGSVIIYQINGCPLDEMIVTKTGNTAVSAYVYSNAVVGESYAIPEGYSYNLKQGLQKIKNVTVAKVGVPICENVNSFIPTSAGVYTLTYSVETDSQGAVQKSYDINAYTQIPACDYEIDWNLSSEYSVGDRITIPESKLSGGVLIHGQTVGKLAIKKNGVTLLGYGDILSGKNYTFNSVGEYTFSYKLGAGETVDYVVNVTDDKIKFITEGLKEYYVKGALIDASAFKVLDDGNAVDYRFTVEYPNGKKYANKKFVLSDVGIYTICAEYDDGQTVHKIEKQITVKAQITDFFTYTASGVSVTHGKSMFTGRTGVIAGVSQAGQLISYTQPINITKHLNPGQKNAAGITKITDSAIPLIEMSIDPRAYGTAAANGVNVYITDAANPENVITINVNNTGNSATWSYIRAAAPNQPLTGFFTESGEMVYDGSTGRVDTSYGMMVYNSAKGQLTNNTQTGKSYHASDSKIALYYDYEKKQLLSINARAETDIVMDFDSSEFVNIPWNGFESDYVYLSFALTGVTGGAANAIVYNIDGNDLSTKDLVYSTAPSVALNDPDANFAGVKGGYLEVPKASAVDCYGTELNVVEKVYYKDGERLLDVSIVDGKFKTDKLGVYYVVYRAVDAFKNVGEKTVEILVEESLPKLGLTLNQSELVTSGGIISKIPVRSATDVIVENGIGTCKVNRVVYKGVGENKQPIEIEDDVLYTEIAGEYLVEYTLTDATGRFASTSYVINVAQPEHPVLLSAMPTFVGFVRGNTYAIPTLYCIDYSAGGERQKAQIYINGELFTSNSYSIERGEVEKVDAEEIDEKVVIEYKCGDYVLASYEVPVKTVYKQKLMSSGIFGDLKPVTHFIHERFFIAEQDISVSAFTDRMLITSFSNDAKLKFVQSLASQNLSFEFDVDFDKSNLEKDENGIVKPYADNLKAFKVTVRDALDSNKTLTILISTDSVTNKVVMTVNGETSQPFDGSLVGITEKLIKFNYSNKTKQIYDSLGAVLIVPKTYENGEKFTGFSDTVYVSFSLIGEQPEDGMKLRLYSLNGQRFASDTISDTGAPYITVNGTLNGIFDVGDKITIPTATASDVFGSIQDGNFTVTVVCEKGESITVIKDVNGLELNRVSPSREYQIELSVSGTYRISYVAVDSNGVGANNPSEYIITVTDQVNPIINLKGSIPQSGKVNEEILLPKFTVTFVEESVNNLCYAVAISPAHDMEVVQDNKFTPKQSGVYTIRYFALDLYGNMQIMDYEITVRK